MFPRAHTSKRQTPDLLQNRVCKLWTAAFKTWDYLICLDVQSSEDNSDKHTREGYLVKDWVFCYVVVHLVAE